MITIDILKGYMKSRHDLNLELIFKGLKLNPEDLPKLEIYLEELVKDGFIVREMTGSGIYEYDPKDWY